MKRVFFAVGLLVSATGFNLSVVDESNAHAKIERYCTGYVARSSWGRGLVCKGGSWEWRSAGLHIHRYCNSAITQPNGDVVTQPKRCYNVQHSR